MTLRTALVASIVLAVGCDTDAIERGVCGNGVVEPGEDCDASDPRCTACSIQCDTTADCLAYDATGGTAGFVCGPDHLCHAPSGLFVETARVAITARSFRATPVDLEDDVPDLVVQTSSTIDVLFGDGAGGIARTSSMQTPIAQGDAFYAPIDDDRSLDVLLPTADGIVSYTHDRGVTAPYPFPSFVPPELGTPLFVHPILDGELGVILFDADGRLQYGVLAVERDPPVPLGSAALCGATRDALATADVDTFELSPGQQIVAVTLRPPGTAPRVCVVTVERASAGAYAVEAVALATSAPLRSRPVLARLRGGTCPSLVVGHGTPTRIAEHAPASASPPCAFVATSRELTGGPIDSMPVDAAPLVPAIANVAPDALVLSTGVFAVRPLSGALDTLYRSPQPIAASRAADLDGDGGVDIVAAGEATEDFALLFRIAPGFLAKHFDTDAVVRDFLVGDFDGNRLLDLAYVEAEAEGDDLVIAYGTSDGLLPGVTVGAFSRVLSFLIARLPDSTDQFNVVDDLAMLYDDGRGVELVLLHGSPERTMLAFFDPRSPFAEPTVFRGVVAGSFDGDAVYDVLAIEADVPASRLWLSQGVSGGELQDTAVAWSASQLSPCLGPVLSNGFCIDRARYATWPVDGLEYVIGVDAEHTTTGFAPALLPGQSAEITVQLWPGALAAPAGATPRQLQVVHLDDGSPRLLVSFDGAASTCTFDVAAGPACREFGAFLSAGLGDTWSCSDVSLARVAAASRFVPPDRDASDYVVLCHNGDLGTHLFRVSTDFAFAQPLAEIGAADTAQLVDVTGDGIADIVALDRSQGEPQLVIHRQCTSRDLGCGPQ